mmetsp:Transcript_73157/g.145102  ORF Transcript_73157/g.145102 Transcript_73157/m.145102 type:complete len:223 (-) Transcript_73157:603-1271(-)
MPCYPASGWHQCGLECHQSHYDGLSTGYAEPSPYMNAWHPCCPSNSAPVGTPLQDLDPTKVFVGFHGQKGLSSAELPSDLRAMHLQHASNGFCSAVQSLLVCPKMNIHGSQAPPHDCPSCLSAHAFVFQTNRRSSSPGGGAAWCQDRLHLGCVAEGEEPDVMLHEWALCCSWSCLNFCAFSFEIPKRRLGCHRVPHIACGHEEPSLCEDNRQNRKGALFLAS